MIRIGTSGFSFADWVGSVYPPGTKPSQMLSLYCGELGFDALEINYTYYTMPSERSMMSLARRLPDGFDVVVKAFKGMTHDPFDPRLETRPATGDVKGYFAAFVRALEPLRREGKLGGVLLQFPVFFQPSGRSFGYLRDAKEWLGDIPVAVEFRARAWANDETLSFLKENGLAYCAVDEPNLPRLMPFVGAVTSTMGYVRLHGRNPNWFNAPVAERYDYLYAEGELEGLAPSIRQMGSSAGTCYVFFNNCHRGSAAKNALAMKRILGLPVKKWEDVARGLF